MPPWLTLRAHQFLPTGDDLVWQFPVLFLHIMCFCSRVVFAVTKFECKIPYRLGGVSLRPFLEEPRLESFPAGDATANKTLAFSQYPHSSESFGRAKGGLLSCVFYRDGQCHINSTSRNTRGGQGQAEQPNAGDDPAPSNWMGFSVRSHQYRYTVWLPAPGGNDSHVDWAAAIRDLPSVANLRATRFDELYDHSGDTSHG